MYEQAYVHILKRVGGVLLVVGLIDIGVMIYCAVNRISYSSSFNVFAVIAGIFLLRGSLGAASIVLVRGFSSGGDDFLYRVLAAAAAGRPDAGADPSEPWCLHDDGGLDGVSAGVAGVGDPAVGK